MQENCFLECRARILLKKCGCLPYYYPRLVAVNYNAHYYKLVLTIIIYPRLDAILQFVDGFENLTAACTLEVGTMCHVSCHCNTVSPVSGLEVPDV